MKFAQYAQAGLLLATLGAVLCATQAFGQNPAADQTVKNDALQATMRLDGSYELDFLSAGWKLEGHLPGTPADVRTTDGQDKIGQYHQVAASSKDGSRTDEIRVYDTLPLALFRDRRSTPSENMHPFPIFQRLPDGLLRLGFQRKNFGFYEFGKLGPEGPWLLFDKQNHSMVISPADHFMVSSMDELPDGSVDSRIISTIQRLPAGFDHDTLIAAATGINRAFAVWGSALLALGGKQRPANDADVTLAKLGYWTDNKTTYYYTFDPKLGYTGTLLAVRDEFKRLGVPLGYMQLDSWFYPKGPLSRWDTRGDTLEFGEDEYRADKELFPKGLEAFHSALGLPMVTHARWVSPQSPYHKEFTMSGNAVIDPQFWKSTADYLHDAGVVTYEQDWLDEFAQTMPNLNGPSSFLSEMASAMTNDGLSIQYCMPLPSNYMATTLYPAVQTIRTSGDGFERAEWDRFLYDSRMASALGLWPWTDAFFSKDMGSLVISTLSAGPVGVGDAIGEINAGNLMAAVRSDGVIIKPDASLLPIDEIYKSDALGEHAPMVAAAVTDFDNLQIHYVFAYPRRTSDSQVTVSLDELGVSGPAFAYNWVTHEGRLIPPGGSLTMEFNNGWAFQVLSPVSRDGLALLGDREKITTMGKARFASVKDDGSLSATIQFASDEKMRFISGYASHRPTITATTGMIETVSFGEQSHIFTAQVLPGSSQQAEIQISAR
jgi:hypothetical protein